MPVFDTIAFAWLFAGSLVWLFFWVTGLMMRWIPGQGTVRNLAEGVFVSLFLIVSWPAFLYLARREVISEAARIFRGRP